MPATRLSPRDKITITVRLDYRQRDHIARIARRSNISMNTMVVNALEAAYPQNREDQPA